MTNETDQYFADFIVLNKPHESKNATFYAVHIYGRKSLIETA